MADVWYYEVNGFELGPVPTSEIGRLLAKGRVASDTPVRSEQGGGWHRVEDLGLLKRPETVVAADPWYVVLLDRFAVVGIPLGVALLPWGRAAGCAGALTLTPFVLALVRTAVDIHRGLKDLRSPAPR